jgi:hypothetical protein
MDAPSSWSWFGASRRASAIPRLLLKATRAASLPPREEGSNRKPFDQEGYREEDRAAAAASAMPVPASPPAPNTSPAWHARCEARRSAVAARWRRHRHQSRAIVRSRLVGLLRRRDGNGSSQAENRASRKKCDRYGNRSLLDEGTYELRARLNVSLPGLDCEAAQGIVAEAHQTYPYSKAVRGDIDVRLALV